MSEYVDAVNRGLEGCEAISVGFCDGCPDCPEEQDEGTGDEGGFSWTSCDCCGSSLGGDRFAAHFLMPDEHGEAAGQPIQHMEVCVDCLSYLANGDEPESWEG